ncbi:hypothetical protein ACFQ1E_01990 [Sphingomonas canadensis]|uniref:Uncharacterized protein n=1 Tax=Sphingomonas canadensis TaxID=1219257 RepID=A0ABW3H0W9_9SPHN|nr:hypothetical protein [Sphingomonas canadensis]MCW3834989.1 hypothetical protein [Sphingomonas canadensis]
MRIKTLAGLVVLRGSTAADANRATAAPMLRIANGTEDESPAA